MRQYETFGTLPEMEEAFFTIGNFDGLHLGHRSLIESMKREASGKPLVAVTFHESPRKFYHPDSFTGYVLPMHFKRILFAMLGIDHLVCLDFPAVKDVEAEDFLKAMTSRSRRTHLTVGYNFRFGKDGRGDTEFLRREAEKGLIELNIAERFLLDGEVVHSTVIRNLIRAGDVEKAGRFIGMPFFLYTHKVHGDRVGHKIGFPTLNLAPNEQVLPGFGVYHSIVFYRGEFLPAMSYVGRRPTLDGHEIRIEANVLDFDEELPDGRYILLFIRKIREEKKFHNLEELKEMLYNDRTVVRVSQERYALPKTIKDLLTGGHNVEQELG